MVHSVYDLNGGIIATLSYNVLATHVCYTTYYNIIVKSTDGHHRDSSRTGGGYAYQIYWVPTSYALMGSRLRL